MVRLRRDMLAAIYCILLVILVVANWVGIRERYVVSSLPCSDIEGIAAGDLDVSAPGDELVFWTASDIYAVFSVTGGPRLESVCTGLGGRSNPLSGVAISDFTPERKGAEMMALTANGTVLLFWRESGSWNSTRVADLPWPSPVWTTHAMIGARFDAASSAAELVVIGQHFDWPTLNATGRVLAVSRQINLTWQVSVVYITDQSLLCGAAGDLNLFHPGLELVTAGEGAAVETLAVTNGSWSATSFFNWSGVIPSLTIGNLDASIRGYEVGLVLNSEAFVVYYTGTEWQPRQIWRRQTQILMHTLIACDVDPFHPGDELLGLGVSTITGESVLMILFHDGALWSSRVLLTLPKDYVTGAQVASFDFIRDGMELVIASKNLLSVYATPSFPDRTLRATTAVLLPAIVLLPGTVVLIALADYVGRVAAERRRKYGLLMAVRGFVQCPVCKRFLPRTELEAHRRFHSRGQVRIAR